MRILITGGRGQLAVDLIRAFGKDEVFAPARAELDVADRVAVEAAIEQVRPDVVINTAAFHQVDRCEGEVAQSFLINAAAPQWLAAAGKSHRTLFIHISTDYVFDGGKRTPYVETDPVAPLSVYGASKAAGEMVVRATTERHLIIRTSGLYGHGGLTSRHGNFVETMLRRGGAGDHLSVVSDQVLTPTYTVDVAEVVVKLTRMGATGTYHVTSGGSCSWHEFAAEIFRQSGTRADLRPVTQAERPVPARRPAYSVLGHDGILRLGIPELRAWQDALSAYLVGPSRNRG